MVTRNTVVADVGPAPVASRSYDVGTMALSMWMVAGVFVDGWAHINLASTRETFFTPWHGLLYSGFAATAVWVAVPIVRQRDAGLLAAVRAGYGLGVVGLVVFGLGGAGDALWHTLLGIEVGVDALLSPTHLLLLAGGILLLTSPLRAAWGTSTTPTPRLSDLLPAVVSATLTAALVAFFFAYAWGALDLSPTRAVPAGALDENSPDHAAAEAAVALGILSRLVTTAVLVGPLLLLTRRWRLPRGTATILFVTVSALLFGLYEDAPATLLLPPLFAGVVADAAARAVDSARPATVVAYAAGVTLVLWSAHFAVLAATLGLGWTPELWGGAIAMPVLAAAGMAVLGAGPAPRPGAAPAAG